MKDDTELQMVEHHGRETAYNTFGDGADVLCVHGSGGTHEVWKSQLARLEEPVGALDLSGHGRSDDIDTEPGSQTLDAYADDVLAVAEETGSSVLVGNSLGGAVVQHIVLERDYEPDGIVLAGTGAKLSVLPRLLELLKNDFDSAVDFIHGEDKFFHDPESRYVEYSREAMRETGMEVTYRDFETCNQFDVRDEVSEIDVPTLAVVGEYDRLTPVEYHEFFAQAIDDCRLQVLPDAAHLAMLEEPDEFNAVLEDFLGRVLS